MTQRMDAVIGLARAAAPVPKYHRVKETVLARIADGTWPPGALLPAEPDLCQEFGVSRITVRKAISDLVHQGKIQTVQGKGTFVAMPKVGERFVQRAFGIYEDMERRGLRLSTEVLRQEVISAPEEVRAHLGLRPGDRVHVIVRLRSIEGEKILISTTYIPEALCPGLVHEDLSTGSLFRLLRDRYGIKIGRGERSLEAVAADQWQAHKLDLALASPLLRLDSKAYLPDGRIFEYSQTFQRGDRARVDLEFVPAPDDEHPRSTSLQAGGQRMSGGLFSTSAAEALTGREGGEVVSGGIAQ
jgi:GntR family transcriptional regulator